MAVSSILRNAYLVELHSRKRVNTAAITYSSSHEFSDPYKLGFYFLIKGRCNLVFEVLKLRKAEYMPNVQSEEETDDQDLNERQQVYKTAVEAQEDDAEPENSSPRKVQSFEKAEARILMEKMATVTDENLDSMRVEDYDEYFKDLYSTMIATGKMREGSMKRAHVDKY